MLFRVTELTRQHVSDACIKSGLCYILKVWGDARRMGTALTCLERARRSTSSAVSGSEAETGTVAVGYRAGTLATSGGWSARIGSRRVRAVGYSCWIALSTSERASVGRRR